MTASPEHANETDLVSIASDIVSAYVSNNPLPVGELSKLIGDTYAALQGIGTSATPVAVKLEPAVSIKKSVTPDFIICLEDGKKFKSLKRHIRVHYNLSPEEYRQKWSLPADYPMVAPTYAATRSALAKVSGLGRKPAVPQQSQKNQSARAATATATTAAVRSSPAKKSRKGSVKI